MSRDMTKISYINESEKVSRYIFLLLSQYFTVWFSLDYKQWNKKWSWKKLKNAWILVILFPWILQLYDST